MKGGITYLPRENQYGEVRDEAWAWFKARDGTRHEAPMCMVTARYNNPYEKRWRAWRPTEQQIHEILDYEKGNKNYAITMDMIQMIDFVTETITATNNLKNMLEPEEEFQERLKEHHIRMKEINKKYGHITIA